MTDSGAGHPAGPGASGAGHPAEPTPPSPAIRPYLVDLAFVLLVVLALGLAGGEQGLAGGEQDKNHAEARAPSLDVHREMDEHAQSLRRLWSASPLGAAGWTLPRLAGLMLCLWALSRVVRATASGGPPYRPRLGPRDLLRPICLYTAVPLLVLWLLRTAEPALGLMAALPEPADGSSMMIASLVAYTAIALFMLRRLAGANAAGVLRATRRDLFLAALAYLCFLPIFYATAMGTRLAMYELGVDSPMQNPLVRMLAAGPGFLVLAGAVVCLAAPLAEELLFRGTLYPLLRGWMGGSANGAIAVSAALFALAHANLAALAPIFILGVLLAWTLEVSGSLVVPMTLHALHNGMTLAILLLERAAR